MNNGVVVDDFDKVFRYKILIILGLDEKVAVKVVIESLRERKI